MSFSYLDSAIKQAGVKPLNQPQQTGDVAGKEARFSVAHISAVTNHEAALAIIGSNQHTGRQNSQSFTR
jgi:hypothetical protein